MILLVQWVANQEHPLSLTSSTSSAVLQINTNGNLELIQREKLQNSSSTIWSTNVDLPSNRTSENLWQSFENPCDTFLSGSILGFNFKTYKLTSWKSESDPSPGNFTLGIRKKTPPKIVIWINNGSKSTIYSRNGRWNKLRFTSNGNPNIYSLYKTPFNLVENVDQGTTYFNNSILYLSLNGIVMVLMKDKGDYGNV
ncbi:hypothetical protein F8388_024545 [Cannabis sativa]|uniref:Bulb-type lectin domain-containing protein n=1 Tax=Cannabis sativa TaxID=3483 RepID=A0A7J6GBS2_CANSA|nr:hypothetical protein F8388_024545 [Cannabis sativa]